MAKLISRDRFIPGGWQFYQPEIKFTARPNMSFRGLVEALINARQANPHLVQKHGWSLDYDTVANEVDLFNATICEQMGWTDYFSAGTPESGRRSFPHPQTHLHPSRAGAVVGGAKILVDWIKSGAEAVPAEQAEKRALVCSRCPLNERGDFSRWFTVPVSEAIRATIADRNGMGLKTSHDEQLSICGACLCPLKLMVHIPLEMKLKSMNQESKDALWENCWIRAEQI